MSLEVREKSNTNNVLNPADIVVPIELTDLVLKTVKVNQHPLTSDVVLTTADIQDSLNKRYITDAEKLSIDNIGSSSVIDITMADISNMSSGSQFVIGSLYRITDYARVNTFPEGQISSTVEPIIVKATAINSLVGYAISESFPQDQIIFNSIIGSVIVYRKDTVKNIECFFDWRGFRARRYTISSSYDWNPSSGGYTRGNIIVYNNKIYIGCKTTIDVGVTPDSDQVAWAMVYDLSNNAHIFTKGSSYIGGISISTSNDYLEYPFIGDLSNSSNVYLTGSPNDYFDTFFNSSVTDFTAGKGINYNNSFFGTVDTVELKEWIACSTFMSNLSNVVIGKNVNCSFYGCSISDSIIGHNANSNTITALANFSNNEIGGSFSGNIIGGSFTYLTIGDNFSGNAILGMLSNSSIGSVFVNNIILPSCSFQYNTIGIEFETNTINNNFQNNTINNNCIGNTITGSMSDNTVFEQFQNNVISGNFQNNTIDIMVQNNTFSNSFQNNVVGNGFVQNHINAWVQHNTFGSICTLNTFNSDFQNNVVNYNFSSNTIGSSDSSTFGINCQNNTISSFLKVETTSSFIGNTIPIAVVSNKFININNLDLTGAEPTHLGNSYYTEVYNRPDTSVRLKYMDNNDLLTVTLVTA